MELDSKSPEKVERPPSSSDSDSDSGLSDEETQQPRQSIEWLATAREKRSTAGNRMKSMLANEEPDSDLELLFAEDEDDQGFTDVDDGGSDVHMDSSSDDEDENNNADDDMEGEKELEQQAREKRAVQRKRKAQAAIPVKFRKKVRIDPSTPSPAPSSTATTATAAHVPRPKKKSERTSWLPSVTDMPTRASSRQTTRLSKEQLHAQMEEREARRLKQVAQMQKNAAKLEALKKPPMTQEERLREAELVEKRNSKSLNRWEAAEKQREEERLAKLAALNERTLQGPVITFWSGTREWKDGGTARYIMMEEKPKKKPREKKDKAKDKKDEDKKDDKQKPPENGDKEPAKADSKAEGETAKPDSKDEKKNAAQSEAPEAPEAPKIKEEPAATTEGQSQGQVPPTTEEPPKEPPKASPQPGSTSDAQEAKPQPAEESTQAGVGGMTGDVQDEGKAPLPKETASNTPASEVSQPPATATVLLKPPVHTPTPTPLNSGLAAPAPPPDTSSSSPHPPDPKPSSVLAAPVLALPVGMDIDQPVASSHNAAPNSSPKSQILAPPNTSQNPQPPPPKSTEPAPSKDVPPPSAPTTAPTTVEKPSVPEDTPSRDTPSGEQPAEVKEENSTYTRNSIVYQNFDDTALKDKSTQIQILFGRKMNRIAKPPPQAVCVITNHPARYRDPKTGLPFYNAYAYREIQRLTRGDYRWSAVLNAWVGGGTYAARGVPERFLKPDAPGGGGGKSKTSVVESDQASKKKDNEEEKGGEKDNVKDKDKEVVKKEETEADRKGGLQPSAAATTTTSAQAQTPTTTTTALPTA